MPRDPRETSPVSDPEPTLPSLPESALSGRSTERCLFVYDEVEDEPTASDPGLTLRPGFGSDDWNDD